MNKIYLHVGVHKTATTFLQKNIFNNLDKNTILYNPEKLSILLNKYFKLPKYRDNIKKEFKKELKCLDKYNTDIFISYEIMSGDLFSCYGNYKEQAESLKILFKGYDVELVIVLRYQVDWLISTYRESVHEHHYQPIESFLNIKNGQFVESMNNNQYANCNALSLDFYSIIDNYFNIFGKKNVHILYFEDFKEDKKSFIKSFEKILGTKLKIEKLNSEITNRGYSSNGITAVLKFINILKKIRLSFLIPRPIYFFGEKSIYIKDDQNEYNKSFVLLMKNFTIKKLFFWFIFKVNYKLFGRGKFFRYVVKKIIDKIQYQNKSMLSKKLIAILDEYYIKENLKILRLIKKNELPQIYIDGKSKLEDK